MTALIAYRYNNDRIYVQAMRRTSLDKEVVPTARIDWRADGVVDYDDDVRTKMGSGKNNFPELDIPFEFDQCCGFFSEFIKKEHNTGTIMFLDPPYYLEKK